MREQIARLFAGILCDDEECWMSYTSEADLILPLMEKVAQAAIDASADWAKTTKDSIVVTNPADFNDPNRLTKVALEQAELAIRALSPKAIVEGVK